MHIFNEARTLTIRGPAFPTEHGESIFTCHRIHGTEKVGELFEYTAEVRTDLYTLAAGTGLDVDLGKLIGTSATVDIQIEGNGEAVSGLTGEAGESNIGAGTRQINGMIDAARFVRQDGRTLIYELVLCPWLKQAQRTIDARLFLDANVEEITREVLGKHPLLFELRIGGPSPQRYYPKRDVQRQHFEDDYSFLRRLWEEWGWFFWFEHSAGEHRLILTDNMGGHQPQDVAYRTIRYLTPGQGHVDEEYIDTLSITSALTTGIVENVDHDYAEPRNVGKSIPLAGKSVQMRQTTNAQTKQYVRADAAQPRALGTAHARNDAFEELQHFARVRVESLRSDEVRAKGHGNLRGLATGRFFDLIDYPHTQSNGRYMVVSATLDITDLSVESGSRSAYSCKVDFELTPLNFCFRLEQKTPKPRTNGPEIAVVVGPENHAIWTDDMHRVLVQFIWDREGRFDHCASIWIRVATPSQGGQRGHVLIPRIGDEVLVDFLHGDPDLPVIVGSVPNKWNLPAWELPRNFTLSGFRSQDLKGGASNHLAFDDDPGKLQSQLASDHGASILSLGFIRRISGNEGRQDARGEGYELRTDHWGALRAAKGMLITTHGRESASGKVKDAEEAIARLTQARDMHEGLAGLAQQHGAQKRDVDQSDVTRSIKQQTADIRGAANGGSNDFPEFAQPHITLSSPAGVQTSTGGSTHIQSDEDTAITTGRSIGIAAGRSLHASVLEKISLFVRKAGMMLVAASGKIHVEAQSDGIDIIAKKDVHIVSEDGWINLTALKGIRLNGAGTTVELSAAGLLGATNGIFQVHAADHKTDGPQSTPPAFPSKTYTDQASLVHQYHDGEPVQSARFDIHYDDGKRHSGTLDSAGHADLSGAPVGSGRVSIGPDSRPLQVKANDPNPGYKSGWSERDFSASANKQNNGDV